ncbi:MAG: response regulator transcription factor, partial [Chloroflexi bacterium]|nr:response regulator transcription factor [Chloroflexota bacterium]
MPDRPIRVLIADDHEIVRAGIRLLVNGQADMEVIGEARDGAESVKLAVATAPDVVLMDISMPVMTGIEATRAIKASNSEIEIVGL